MISRFFIDRPIFASVLSIVVTLAGGIAVLSLPIALYPPISPPTVTVNCNYPGASAEVVSETVGTPIEQQVNGVENMLYMSSQCTNDGSYNLTVTFRHGVNLNLAQVLVQNRVSLALPQLPDVLRQTGVVVKKQSPDILMAVALVSPDNRYDQLYLSNYAVLHVVDQLSRLDGVSEVRVLGQRDYSIRVWLDPDQLAHRDMSASDVVAALREQNVQVAAGQIGQSPSMPGQIRQVPLDTLGRLTEPEQFGAVVVKSTMDGKVVRLRDIARIEMGAKNEDLRSRVNLRPAVGMAVFQLPDANALDTAVIVKKKMAELRAEFPEGVDFEIRYDTTPFISESIGEVLRTLREAIILVAIVVLLFLQNWRSALIPLIAVPVAIVGTFAVMAAFGFSLNNLTLFGLVLAIGIVVDDAIVVVEAVEHHIEHGMAPRDATVRAMAEVSGPVIAIGLVLSAVFVPCAFISGIIGQFFRQFALTIAASTIISTINSLTLSPALAAMLLRPRRKGRDWAVPRVVYAAIGAWVGYAYLRGWVGGAIGPRVGVWASRTTIPEAALRAYAAPSLAALAGFVVGGLVAWPVDVALTYFFRGFNVVFRGLTWLYVGTVGIMIRVSLLMLVVYGGLLGATYWGFKVTPAGFIPSQDMGYLLANVQLPDSVSAERTETLLIRAAQAAHATKGVRFTQIVVGQSLLLGANGPNFGTMFIILDDFEHRRSENLSGMAIIKTLTEKYRTLLPEAMFTVLPPPPVRGVGRAGGFKVMIEDRGDNGSQILQKQADELTKRAAGLKTKSGMPVLVGMTSVFRANVPQVFVDVDRKETMSKLVRLQSLFDTLRIYLGSIYVNDFNRFGRTWQVIVQADSTFRNTVDEVRRLKVRNEQGKMVPIGSLAKIEEINGPLILPRYNMYPAAPINGAAAPGISSREAIDALEALSKDTLLGSMQIEWTELAYLELQAGNTAMAIFGLAVVMVFLVLAAQYESWSMPLAIILVVPMCLLSAIGGVNFRGSIFGYKFNGEDINIFTQIGFVVLVGLASKNAILIVEFAKSQRDEGASRRRAALDACRLRLRPIIMTSMAFILGVSPLIVSAGAGSEMRRTLGITVFSGMLGVTFFGIFLTPVFFVVIDWLGETKFFRAAETRLAGRIVLWVLLAPLLPLIFLGRGIRRELRRRPRGDRATPKPTPISDLDEVEAPTTESTPTAVEVAEFSEQS